MLQLWHALLLTGLRLILNGPHGPWINLVPAHVALGISSHHFHTFGPVNQHYTSAACRPGQIPALQHDKQHCLQSTGPTKAIGPGRGSCSIQSQVAAVERDRRRGKALYGIRQNQLQHVAEGTESCLSKHPALGLYKWLEYQRALSTLEC